MDDAVACVGTSTLYVAYVATLAPFLFALYLDKLRKKLINTLPVKMHSPCILQSRKAIKFSFFSLSYLLQTRVVSTEYLTASTKVIRN